MVHTHLGRKREAPESLIAMSRRETLERIDLPIFLFLQWDTKDDDHFQKEVEEKGRQCRDNPISLRTLQAKT